MATQFATHPATFLYTSTGIKEDLFKFIFTPINVNAADNKLFIVFLFFPESKWWHFMQIVSQGENLHKISSPLF